MEKNYLRQLRVVTLLLVLFSSFSFSQNFSQSTLNFNGFGAADKVTALMFGPDGRLYTVEYEGLIKIYTIERLENGTYQVVAKETLNDIQTIQNHNDDGSLDTTTNRETTGITVAGTASNPIIYVTSSDYRIGGGSSHGDVGLDTNSGIITRYIWNGTSWDIADIVRGLPRSEENHGTHGLDFTQINGEDYLLVCSGGNTNGGSPSKNFTYLPEYALSAAIITVNLTQIESLPILNNNGRNYIYDLPTLDDPTRPNENGIEDPNAPGYDGIDVNDPFGGNDGLNQAKIVAGSPVQIFSPGYRNSYDLVVTNSGAVYVTENGANGGWGGFPINEGTANVTNNYDSSEPGSSTPSGGEQINNEDQLHVVTTDIDNYIFGSVYGGHPNPTRANPSGAGLFTAPEQHGLNGAVFRTLLYDPDGSTPNSTTDSSIGLPADWPPLDISNANPVEGDWRGPGEVNPDGPVDNAILIWGTNTNGIDEYTASNFNGAMQGNLLAGTNTGILRRVELDENGNVGNYTESFISGLGGNVLGVTCNGDTDIFPGTIWVGNFNQNITVLEPQDFIECIDPSDLEYDPLADYDNDGYTNQDEEDNLTDPCNGGSQPTDFDKEAGGTLTSNLHDDDDDNDGILDINDPFQLGDFTKTGSDAFVLPVINELFSDNPLLGGYLGLGLTGMMNNGDGNGNWLNWIDRRDDPNEPNPNDILGGAIGAMTMQMTSGTALGTANTQEKAFQYGIQSDTNTGIYTVKGEIVNFNQPLQLYGNTSAPNGELGFFIGDGTQSNYIKFVARQQGLRVQQEINDIPQTPIDLNIDINNRPEGLIIFNFTINPTNGEITLEYTFDNDTKQTFGTILAQGAILNAIQQSNEDLAVGFIGTSNAPNVELEGTWGVLSVTKDQTNPIELSNISDQIDNTGTILDNTFGANATGGDGDLIYSASGLPEGISIDSNTGVFTGTIAFTAANNSPYNVTVTVDDSDGDSTDNVSTTFNWVIMNDVSLEPFLRINSGGTTINDAESGINWEQNNIAGSYTGSNFFVNTGKVYANGVSNLTRHNSIPDYISESLFTSLFATERYDDLATPEMKYSISVPNDDYVVNLYLCNTFDGTQNVDDRVFNILIENNAAYTELDLVIEFGHQTAGMLSYPVSVTDGVLDIEFLHNTDNPLVNAIEIMSLVSVSNTPIIVQAMANQTNYAGETLNGSLVVSAQGGDGNLNYTAIGLPPGLFIEPTNGQIGGTINLGAEVNSPYSVTITVDDDDEFNDDTESITFSWEVTSFSHPINSDALYRINAGGTLIAATDSDIDWESNNT
ncbi:malectin domain-containing carbohydrate-binding protein, partial [Neotamlana sedimentorum]|uniref:malectin domain-containing carbohydrate-binding protein n=1 Tax=Neotamlana sedimentorum TaxID=1435349 RepID=UPI0005CBF14C